MKIYKVTADTLIKFDWYDDYKVSSIEVVTLEPSDTYKKAKEIFKEEIRRVSQEDSDSPNKISEILINTRNNFQLKQTLETYSKIHIVKLQRIEIKEGLI
jgi:hypothetical protein